MITGIQLLIGLSLIIAAICIYFIWFKPKDLDMDEAIPFTICSILISIFVGFFMVLGVRFIDATSIELYKPICEITSIKNTDITSGNFMLGCGSIRQTEYYFYFYKTLNGGYARGKNNVNNTVIVENDDYIPHIQQLTTCYKSKSGWFKFREQTQEDYKIIVPKGTLINKFKLY